MTVRYHIPASFILRNELSSDEAARLQNVVTEAIRRAVAASASSASAIITEAEEREDSVELFSSERDRPDRDAYAIPSYDDEGRPREVPVERSPVEAQAETVPTSADTTAPSSGSGGLTSNRPVTTADILAVPIVVRTFDQVWQQFSQHRALSRDDQAQALVPDLLSRMSTEDALSHARGLAIWLMDRGERTLAEMALRRLESAWWLRYVGANGPGVPTRSITDDPHTLTERGMAEARGGNHEQAFLLFGLAFLFSQMQFQELSNKREEALTRTESGLDRFGAERFRMAEMLTVWGRMFNYGDISSLIESMREILGFYPSLERDAQRAGNQTLAAQYSSLGLLLRTELRDHYTLAGARGITMESTQTLTSSGGIGYTIHGRQGSQEVVTPLPGTRTPQEIGVFPSYTSTMEELLASISGQEEFVTALNAHPEIRAAFGTRRINMSDVDERLRVWRIMYRIFQRESLNPLHSLLRLMERYLNHFTRHTEYNIRDFGVSYLSTEFPEDLAGRAVRDCGVYALTVAYEVYRTARGATPRLDLDFRLYAMPEHVTLVILDRAEDNYYVVNNDRIEGPRTGDVLEGVSRGYATTFSRRYTVTPAVRVDIASTQVPNASFRQLAWQRYRVSTQWGLRPELPTGPADTRTEDERSVAIYRRYYQDLNNFDRGSHNLGQQLDQLSQSLQSAATDTARLTLLNTEIPRLINLGIGLVTTFDTFGPHAQINASNAQVVALMGNHALYLFASQGNQPNPLARLGMALLLFANMGNALTNDQQTLIQWLRSIPQFRDNLDQYIAAGRRLSF
ncbi:MAG TPA: hypothetical protein VJU84_11360 [Pyrinomonadaceae bacterium]|nr:hypothetical protein [Pyrinomonadaceae bacterium]